MKTPVVPANTPEEMEIPDEAFFLDQLSGSEERGVANPPIRIPIKTHLKDVFLKTNPWHDRKLHTIIDQLDKEKRQKLDALNWAQRQFFVSSVFDHDKLHFVTDKSNEEQIETSEKQKLGRDCDHFPPLKAGIFAQTSVVKESIDSKHGTEQQNEEIRDTVRSQEQTEMTRTQSLPLLGVLRQPPAELNSAKLACSPKLTKRTSLPDIKLKNPTPSINALGHKGIRKTITTNYESLNDLHALGETRPGSAYALPRIRTKQGSVQHTSIHGKNDVLDAPLHNAPPIIETSRYHKKDCSSEDRKDELCDDKIIHRLFCTLPEHLKEVANVKSNEITTKIRNEMISRTKKKCNGEALLDERWKALVHALRKLNSD
ncbi:unnamed protein product [Owenia fusiformis]|uniref:Uncharacterized protein n=1 Tax=Owenia fusiformis TaxID=6347 RepID=A0A8J1XXM7_OWEFU|nr:unnamed protein product [Owenia fusiformis]